MVSGEQYRSITFPRDIAVIDRTCVFSTICSLDADRTCSFSGTLSLSAHRALKVANGTIHLKVAASRAHLLKMASWACFSQLALLPHIALFFTLARQSAWLNSFPRIATPPSNGVETKRK